MKTSILIPTAAALLLMINSTELPVFSSADKNSAYQEDQISIVPFNMARAESLNELPVNFKKAASAQAVNLQSRNFHKTGRNDHKKL